jgi:hypothetical protein
MGSTILQRSTSVGSRVKGSMRAVSATGMMSMSEALMGW